MDNDNFLGRWIAGELTEEERTTFEQSADYLAYKDILRATEKFERPTFDIEKRLAQQRVYNQTYTEAPKQKTIKLNSWYYVAATAAVLVALIGIKSLFFTSTTIQTAIAETKVWTLPDQSTVTLNADSAITYDETTFDTHRIVILEGEAFFDITTGSTFTVQTSNGAITVLGTQFNVQNRETFFGVNCYEGKVQVQNKKDTAILTPQMGVHATNDSAFIPTTLTQTQPDWMQGRSSFQKAPLKQLIQELERQYAITIMTEGIDLTRQFSGSFAHDNLQKALKICFEPMQITYTFVSDKKIVLTNK